ncbi:subclass B1 metallo-beta-lactamase [Hymenobacter aerilatus]|uniref:beta-lactamase n=1 Tax=Hymenobacter aerilatus TaxID=2932251 RepID=A0A8T9T1V7_9BACT|nr:subclass B1 metallo-beta-lactamase [Hymenobacter aerilatus]UOR05979.1 subclass B1 metallo-beta-lactamase [Hymenobacter aerilatus]
MKFLVALLLVAGVAAAPRAQTPSPETGTLVYQSTDLRIVQVAPNTFVHTSFLHTESFGQVACNGLIVQHGTEAVVFDTPTHEQESEELITWITNTRHCTIKAVIPTHFHEDCLGGLPAFARHQIPSYAHKKTIVYAKQHGAAVPQHGFTKRLTLRIGSTNVYAAFWGEGHTKDNIVGYFPADDVLFGGCLVKELRAGKGNLADANTAAWPATVHRVQQAYPRVKIVVPGHGQVGDRSLLAYTIQLFHQP